MRTLLLAVALWAPAWASAAEPLSPDAADPRAAAAQPAHCSVLRQPPERTEPERRDWPTANADTAAAGGWRAYAKEAARAPARPPRSCPAAGAPR
jgi:hypothetical protein